MAGTLPELSVVLPAPVPSETLRLVLAALREMFRREESEAAAQGLRVRLIEVDPDAGAGEVKAAGVRAAAAGFVAFIEDHSVPEPGWVGALLAAHRGENLDLVSPLVLCGNPGSAVSRASFIVFYGRCATVRSGDDLRHLPSNNSSYRAPVLSDYGADLPRYLGSETHLHWDLLARGARVGRASGARVRHINPSRLVVALPEFFFASRLFAAGRSLAWGRLRRLAWVGGSFLLPLYRLPSILRDARASGMGWAATLAASPAAVVILCAGAAGEALGYAAGEGSAAAGLARVEAGRHRHVSARDLAESALPVAGSAP
jgi:hypothetical protein